MHRSSYILALFAALFTVAAPSASFGAGDIVVAAQETEAIVAPRAAHLELVNLPTLEFGLRAAFQCRGEPVSVTLSVADTFVSLGREQLAGRRAVEATLAVPARQLALAASSRFCIDEQPGSANELLVPGLATAHASLVCENDRGAAIESASAPLSVRIVCAREPEDPERSYDSE